jgi:hypothetical protein
VREFRDQSNGGFQINLWIPDPPPVRDPEHECEIGDHIEEGLGLLDEAVKIVERTGERWLKAELYRLNGQLVLRQGHTEAAEELYRKALSIAVEPSRERLFHGVLSRSTYCGTKVARSRARSWSNTRRPCIPVCSGWLICSRSVLSEETSR